MRIKRFIAPDMRTALRMVRNEQGPDAVILSNRVTADGIEVVAATDYDEALVAQALRAAAPGLETIVAPAALSVAGGETATFASIAAHLAGATSTSARRPALTAVPAATPAERAAATSAADTRATPAGAMPASGHGATRDGLAARARAVFRIGEGPTLSELTPATQAPAAGISSPPLALPAGHRDADDTSAAPPLTRLEAMMAAMGMA